MGHLSGGATTSAKSVGGRTANDLVAYGHLVDVTQVTVNASPSKVRTAKDLVAGATALSASDTVAGKPTVQRTAKDFTVYAHPNPGAKTDAKPTKARTANDFSMRVTLKAGATVMAVPTKLRTAKDVIAYAAMTGQAVIAVNPNHQRFEAKAYARIKPTTLVVASPKLLSIRNHVAIQRVQVGDSYVDVPIYALGAFPYDALRVMYGDGKIGCYELVDVSEDTPLRIQTPHGVKGIKTLV
jgi:hypothetical protein